MSSSVTIEELKDEAPASFSASSSSSSASPKPEKREPADCSIGAVVDAYEALSLLSNEKFDSKATAKILKLVKWTEELYTDFIEMRMELAAKYGTLQEDDAGKRYVIAEVSKKAFIELVTAAASKPATVPKRLKLAVADLEGAKISPATLLRLRWLLTDLDE